MKFGYIVILVITFFVSGSLAIAQTSSGTQEYGDGGAYDGEFLNGLPHGIGTYELPNGYRLLVSGLKVKSMDKVKHYFQMDQFMLEVLSRESPREVAKLLSVMVVHMKVNGQTEA